MYTGTIYIESTGEILGTITSSDMDGLNAQAVEGNAVILGEFDGAEFYVQAGATVSRPSMSLTITQPADHVGGNFYVDNIPAGTQALGPNFDVIIDDGYLEWYSMELGDFQILLLNFPYKEESVSATFA